MRRNKGPLVFLIIGAIFRLIGRLITGAKLPKELTVQRIIDGDSLVGIDAKGKQHEIRIRGIDAPEIDQPYGPEAKQALSQLTLGQKITLQSPEVDHYGRIAARVKTAEGVSTGKSMIQSGHAWADPDRAKITENFAETKAKIQDKGLWEQKKPKAPWQHRKRKREQSLNEMEM